VRELVLEEGATQERGADESPLAASGELWTRVDLEHGGMGVPFGVCACGGVLSAFSCVVASDESEAMWWRRRGGRSDSWFFEGPVDEGMPTTGGSTLVWVEQAVAIDVSGIGSSTRQICDRLGTKGSTRDALERGEQTCESAVLHSLLRCASESPGSSGVLTGSRFDVVRRRTRGVAASRPRPLLPEHAILALSPRSSTLVSHPASVDQASSALNRKSSRPIPSSRGSLQKIQSSHKISRSGTVLSLLVHWKC
jgi:hypothetical protein